MYHFTSFETALKIIESNSLRFSRLNNMNDFHENGKISFVDNTNHKCIDTFPSNVLDALHDEIYRYRQISLSTDNSKTGKNGFDLHQMWGLYADKGEGACLVFDKDELEKNCDMSHIQASSVNYVNTQNLESFVVSNSHDPNEVVNEIKNRVSDIFFHKRKE